MVKLIGLGIIIFGIIFLILGCGEKESGAGDRAERSDVGGGDSLQGVGIIDIQEFHPEVINYLQENHPEIIKELYSLKDTDEELICKIISVKIEGSFITVEVMAYDEGGKIKSVQVRIDSEPWVWASRIDGDRWVAQIHIEPGFHTIYARSFDGENYSEPDSTVVLVGDTTVSEDQIVGSSGVKIATLSKHDPIIIVGNDEFTAENGVVGGSGTENDPYIIEGWEIDASLANNFGRYGAGIYINSTTDYFIIRNCRIYNGLARLPAGDYCYGIWFENVVNGSVQSTTLEENYNGICMVDVTENQILSCSIAKNSTGINIGGTLHGMDVPIYTGISQYVKISDCNIFNNKRGIEFDYVFKIKVSNCIISNHSDIGICMLDTQFSTVENCKVSSNKIGFKLWHDDKTFANEIKSCVIAGNWQYSIHGWAFWNFFHHNNFINNGPSDLMGSTEYFCFNYWDKYDGDGPHKDGSITDRYPLSSPVDITPPDERKPDMVHLRLPLKIELGTPYEIEAIIADNVHVDEVFLYYNIDEGTYISIPMDVYPYPEEFGDPDKYEDWKPWRYFAFIPEQSFNTKISYYIEAKDIAGNSKKTETFTFVVLEFHPGDVNKDYKVDIRDVAHVAGHFGEIEGDPNWDPTADVVEDGKIDIRDIAIVAGVFGLTYENHAIIYYQ